MAQFTKQAIRKAFLQLLDEKPMSQITVREVVEVCGINRNTFYYYYQDLPQLAESIADEEIERMIRRYPEIESMEECLDAIIEFALEHKKVVLHIYHSVNRDIYEKSQWRFCEHAVTVYVDSMLEGKSVQPSDRRVMIDYLKCVAFGLISSWLEAGMDEESVSNIHRLYELKQGDLEEMISRCKT